MKRMILVVVVGLALATGTARAAEEWGIDFEEKARITAKVVDILCELTGDCPADCGAGKRQLGLLTEEGKLLLVTKNMDIFAGGTEDLIGFCGKKVVADGLYIKNPKAPMFALQFKRLAPDGKWGRATSFSKAWAKKNGFGADSEEAGEWFRHDPTIKKVIGKDGVLGIPGLKPKE